MRLFCYVCMKLALLAKWHRNEYNKGLNLFLTFRS